VILKETAAGLTYALYANDNTPNPAVTVNTGALDLSATGPSEVPLNVWTHLAATYDGTTLRLFVNGTLVGSRAVTGSLVASDGPLRIGGNAVWGEYFEGLIDDVRVYNRALTADEIHGDMAAPVGPPPIPETIIFGTQAYVSTGRPVIDRKTFRVTDLTGEYLLRVMSRGVTAAVITVNGRVVVRPVDLRDGNPANAGASISSIEIPIKVQAGNNQIVVTFYGRLDSVLAVEIVRAVLPPVVSEEPPPTITITSPTSGTVLTEGATIAITVDAMSRTPLSHVDLSVNGVPLSSDVTAPFRFLLTVPTDVAWLTLRVTAVDNKGHTGVSDDVTVGVMPDGLTTVTGRVVNSSNNAVAGAEVMVTVNGLLAEIYNFDTPLSELPDLKGRAPNQVRLVSAANLRNPATVFGLDPFGFGFTSHAVRYKGYLRTTVAGRYTFTFGANAGGRLIVGGVMVVDLPRGDGNFQQASGSVWLPVGWIPIRLLTFDNGNPEVQLSYAAPGTTSEVVPPAVLTPAVIPYRTRSGSTGAFAVPRVPTAFGDLTVSGTFRKVTGTVGPIAPVVDGTTDVGLLHLR
jgi:hypothetical protein